MLMNELAGLWIPIVVSAVVVLVASFVSQLIIGRYAAEWKELPEEEATIEHLQKSGIGPGQYLFPGRSPKSSQDLEETRQQRMNSGPWGTVNIWARQPSMGRNLLQSFVFYLVTSFFVAYLATLALEPGAEFSPVFQVTGTAAILAYAFGGIPNAIWFGSHLRSALMDVINGIVHGLLTGTIFGMLWP